MRRVFSPDRPQLDLERVLDDGEVLLASLSQGTLGPVSAWFLGMMLTGRLQQAVFGRARREASTRRPFTMVLDEFQNLLGEGGYSYASGDRTLGPLLSESRKFGLRLVLANQYTHQLDEGTREAIFGNVGSLLCFRVGASDSDRLARELGGDASSRELRELPLFSGIARLLRNGEPAPLFTLRTLSPCRMDQMLAGRDGESREAGPVLLRSS